MEYPNVALALLVIAIVLLVVFAGGIIFFLRRSPSYKAGPAKGTTAEDAERLKAEYAQAGMPVKSSFFSSPSVTGSLSGVAFVHKVIPGGRNSPSRAVVTARSGMRGQFAVRREGGNDGFFKSIGFAGEVQTGDANFDREFYLLGSSREYVAAMFSDVQNREAVRAIFGLGFDHLELYDGEITASRERHAQLIELKAVGSVLEQLAALRTTPGAQQVAMQGSGGITLRQINTVCAAAAGFAVAALMGILYLLEPMVGGQLAIYEETWRPALYVYVPLVLLAVLALRGRPAAVKELSLVALIGLPGIWGAEVGMGMLANQYLDQSPPREFGTVLVRHYKTTGKNPTERFVLAPWRKAQDAVDLKVSADVYAMAPKQKAWIIRVRAGRLGYEWVDRLAPKPKA